MKVRIKITLCMLGLLSLLFGVGGSLLISMSFQDTLKREKDLAFSSYQMVFETLQIVNEFNSVWDYETVDRVIRQLDGQASRSWTALRLTSESGYRYESELSEKYMDTVIREFRAGEVWIQHGNGPNGGQYLILTGEVPVTGDTLYLCTAHDISSLYTMRQAQQRIYFQVFAAMVLLCAVLSYTISKVLTAPLVNLSRASRAIASGDYSSRADLCSGDEIGAVAADFNAMAVQLEKHVSQLQESVLRQERFMGSFAHELKTPMTSIIGYADLLRDETLTQKERFQAANYIFSEGKRLEGLSQKLLSLFELKEGALSLSEASPADLIRSMVEQLKPIYSAQGVELSCRCQNGVCYLEAALARSLLLNLVDNARKAMDHGGMIDIQQEMLTDGCRICVLDEGRGIPAESVAHLTEAFYRVDKARSREQGGVGLGLALCQEIVRLHHGTMRFENREGQGTRVMVELKGGRPCAQ